MSNFLKLKLTLIVGSISILILIPLFERNFNAPVTMHRWKQLDWDDFQGFVKPFTGWGAGISSNVFIEFDSIQEKFSAYAAMNNQSSWKRIEVMDSKYTLNHEQYHFNITEYHARKLNQLIINKNLSNESEVNSELYALRSELRKMQVKYDKESDHSLKRAFQRMWEYKIDSMLNETEDYPLFQENGNIEVFFPDKPQVLLYSIEDEKFTGNILEKYDALFWILDMNFSSTDTSTIESYAVSILAANGMSDILVHRDSLKGNVIFDSKSKDTLKNEIVVDKWFLGNNTTYWLRNIHPIGEENEEIYQRMGNQFFNSFKVLEE
ncbi:hypothetical protein [Algoriphagus sp.]|uniref:hypothetical protein n=1 Tax=Algoriphagus sp. TaxID=1872435 RepID=UPI003F728E2B